MEECSAYIDSIVKSIKHNLNSLDGRTNRIALQGLVEAFQNFYISLFEPGKGKQLMKLCDFSTFDRYSVFLHHDRPSTSVRVCIFSKREKVER